MGDLITPDVTGDAPCGPKAARCVLVTGFGPFPGVADNPSGQLARSVHGAVLHGVPVVGVELPTVWREAWATIEAAVEAHAPGALVMLGVAADRDQVQIERVARNRNGMSADATGRLPDGQAVVSGAPATLATTLPWAELVGADVGTSDDAGAYLCNNVFYRAVHGLGDRVPYRGFVHVPLAGHEAVSAVLAGVARRVAELG